MNKSNTPFVLTPAIAVMFLLSAYQLLIAQKPQYVPDLGDDAGATCCIGREACEVEEHPPTPSCFYATDHGALPTWYECVAPTCDAWPNTTCWADAAKARHEMGWGGAYEACDYGPRAGANAAQRCFASEAGDSCIGEAFHECVAERCRIWDGSSKDCEEDANNTVHQQASDCGTTSTSASPYALLTQSLDFADKDIAAFTENVKRASAAANHSYYPLTKATADHDRLVRLSVDTKLALSNVTAYKAQPSPQKWQSIQPRFRELARGVDTFATQLWNEGTYFIPEDVGRQLQNTLDDPAFLPSTPVDINNLTRICDQYAAIAAHIDDAIAALNVYLKK